VHVGADGKGSVYPLPTRDSYAAFPALASDGTVWFSYAQGSGMQPTVDTGPALHNEIDYLGWRKPDGRIGRTPIASGAARVAITSVVPGPDGGAWYTAYAESDPQVAANSYDVYGRAWPDGRVATYRFPKGVTYVSGLLPNPDGSVWLVAEEYCTVIRTDPGSGAIRSSTRIPGTGAFDACGRLVRGPGGGLRTVSPDGRIATLDASGRIVGLLTPPKLPGESNGIVSLAEDHTGNLWVLTSNQPTPGNLALIPVLLRITPDGTTTRFTPIPAGPDRSATITMATLRAHPEYLDLSPQFLIIGAYGSVWLSNAAAVDRLG
jgi:streptogramin lyase